MPEQIIDNETGEIIIDGAHERHKRIVQLRNLTEKSFLALSEELYHFYYNSDYETLGYNTFESYLADPEVDINRSSAYRLINIYRQYVLSLKCPTVGLLQAGIAKLDMMAKVITDDNAEEWLNKAATLSRSDLKLEIEAALPPKETPELPDGKYRIIYADPPWSYEEHGVSVSQFYGGATRHYSTMTIEDICKLPISDMAADNAVLFIWVTSPKLNQVWDIINAWGFEYKTSFVWDKVRHNFGYYNSVRHELLLICGKGSSTPDVAELFDSVQVIERNDNHSEKPEEFRKIIDAIYPVGKRIELFARREAPGWDVWGNEVDIHNAN